MSRDPDLSFLKYLPAPAKLFSAVKPRRPRQNSYANGSHKDLQPGMQAEKFKQRGMLST